MCISPNSVATVALQAVGPQRLDNHLPAIAPLAAQKRGAEAAGAEDALRLVVREGERLERLAVEGDGAAQCGQRLRPVASLQGGAIDVVMCLGLRDGIGDQTGHFLKIVLARFEIADDDFELGQAVEQRGQAALVLDRQIAEALDEVLHHFALAVAAQRQTIARPHGAGVQIVFPFELQDRLVQVRAGLAVIVLFRLQI